MITVDALRRAPAGARTTPSWSAAMLVSGITAAVVLLWSPYIGTRFGEVLAVGAAAVVLALCALRSPVFAVTLLVLILFVRLPLGDRLRLPIEPWWIAFALVVVATGLWLARTPSRVRGIGPVECMMVLYLLWNVYSMVTPHEYPAIDPLYGDPLPVAQFIAIGTLLPFALYAVGRYVFDRPEAVRILLWTIVFLAGYSAAVSIMPFVGLGAWVWPGYIVTSPDWDGRAVGIFNQPVVNGMVLVLGFAICLLLLSRRDEPTWRRWAATVVAVACGAGIYLTHTRAVWLSAVVIVVIGVCLATGFRTAFIATLGLVTGAVALNWSVFTSSDRTAGGVASQAEIHSRLNGIETALWARAQKPLEGWGIGRFPSVNRYHHQQWSAEVPWIGGYGEASHTHELGLLAELGIIGLALWLGVLLLIAHRLQSAYRTSADRGLCGRPLAVVAIMAMASLVCTGLTVDLRYFDFPTAVTFLIIGIAVGWAERDHRTDRNGERLQVGVH